MSEDCTSPAVESHLCLTEKGTTSKPTIREPEKSAGFSLYLTCGTTRQEGPRRGCVG